MSVLDLAREFSEDELQDLVDGIFTARVGEEREQRLRELLEDAPPTLREDAVAENPVFADLEQVLGLMPSEAPIEEPVEEAIRERTQAERQAREAVETLIEANMGDADVLSSLARALERLDGSESDLISQERLQQLTDQDREELANAATQAALRAEPLDIADFPNLERALRRRGGRDATYFERVAEELRGDREPESLLRQDVDEDTIQNLRQFHQDVLEEAIATAEQHVEDLRSDRGRAPPSTGGVQGVPSDVGEAAVSSRVRRVVPSESRREDPITGEVFRVDVRLEQRFLSWVIDVMGDTNRFDTLYFRRAPVNRDISMEDWARLQIRAGNASVNNAENAGLPPEWFEGL